MSQLTIGYFADGQWAHQVFRKIVGDPSLRIGFVCARSNRPDPVLEDLARAHQIDFLTDSKINSDEFLARITGYHCDLFVSMSFNQIFRRRLIDHPRLGTINCHAGKLPFYRGRNVLNWALINDEREFGVTVHFIDEGIDTGDIIVQRLYSITDADTYGTLLKRASAGCAELLYETIKQIQAGHTRRIIQTDVHPLGSYCTERVEGDERLNWNQTSRDVFNFTRALSRPGPEARTIRGDAEMKINRVEFLPGAPCYKGIPGTVLGIERDSFLVKTADSYVRVVEWSGVSRVRMGDRLK